MNNNTKYIKVDELRFLVKALRWAANDRNAFAEAYDFNGGYAKQAMKNMNKCLALRKAINDHLSSGGKGVKCVLDDIVDSDCEYLTHKHIQDRINSGDLW
ncbi:MAG: hypothetical protein GF411_14750 [Candidatus Lokiarchaeota archaeon]|nr:hypothetical protein [Candidatus Lokiarchaeota archaeon]